jgi:hypothetical protein
MQGEPAPALISLTVIDSPACTVIWFYTENFLGQILWRAREAEPLAWRERHTAPVVFDCVTSDAYCDPAICQYADS